MNTFLRCFVLATLISIVSVGCSTEQQPFVIVTKHVEMQMVPDIDWNTGGIYFRATQNYYFTNQDGVRVEVDFATYSRYNEGDVYVLGDS